ncbi:MAG TPA: hypothetical protein ENI76_10845 [Ignavibacteria bacterium]|nr:hypothetical protein [Ignavibacteria bacterium]
MEKLNKEQRETLMGSTVVVFKFVKQGWNYMTREKIYTSIECKERKGWIVGFRYLPYGKEVVEDNDNYFVSYKKPCFPCVLISFSPMMNSVQVPMDGYTLFN